MKTGTMVILILLMTGGALAIANKSCKTSPHPWCVSIPPLCTVTKALTTGWKERQRALAAKAASRGRAPINGVRDAEELSDLSEPAAWPGLLDRAVKVVRFS